jgi:hypothetical protein
MTAIFPAPMMRQGADETILLQMARIVFPGFLIRNPAGNGLWLQLDGDYKDPSLQKLAADQFQILLGALRAWRPLAGQREDEVEPGMGSGSIRDEHGNQLIRIGPALEYATAVDEVPSYSNRVQIATSRSPQLRNALWLHGRRDRNAADVYMVYEYAEQDFHGRNAVVAALGVTLKQVRTLRASANNLAPLSGGRHAGTKGKVEWDLDAQLVFIAEFVRKWITHRSK